MSNPMKSRDDIQLAYSGTTLLIRNPDEDDTDQVVKKQTVNDTRGLAVNVFRRNIWSAYRTVTYKFRGLTAAKTDEIKAFLLLSLGRSVGLIDYNDRRWNVYIVNPDDAFTDNGICKQELTLRMEGTVKRRKLEGKDVLPEPTIALPNPQLGNTTACAVKLKLRRSINGSVYTNVKTSQRHIYEYEFRLPYDKAQELCDFLWDFQGEIISFDGKQGVLREYPEISINAVTTVNVKLEEI